jgi:hypothetical protein
MTAKRKHGDDECPVHGRECPSSPSDDKVAMAGKIGHGAAGEMMLTIGLGCTVSGISHPKYQLASLMVAVAESINTAVSLTQELGGQRAMDEWLHRMNALLADLLTRQGIEGTMAFSLKKKE